MSNGYYTSEINFVINCRLNSFERVRRLIYLSEQISKLPNFSLDLRVRGEFSDAALKTIQTIFDKRRIDKKQYNFWHGTNSGNNWKIDTLIQVLSRKSEYVITLQEDHFMHCSVEYLEALIRSCRDSKIDFMPLTFFPHIIDNNTISALIKDGLCVSNYYFNFFYICKNNFDKFEDVTLLSQVGLYKRKLLINILKSEKPFVKKYNHKTPYSFEQAPGSKWFLPLLWGYPKNEIFACVDDDHGISGYSLASRGLWKPEKVREIEYYNPILGSNSFFIKYKYFFMPIVYTLYSALTRPYRFIITKLIDWRFSND